MEPKPVPDEVANLKTLREMVDLSVDRYGERVALALRDGKEFTYGEIGECLRALRSELTSGGIEPGSRVALLGENKPEWGIAYLAVTSMAAVIVPILPDFSGEEVTSIIEHSGAQALIVSKSLEGKVGEVKDLGVRLTLEDIGQMRQDVSADQEYRSPEESDLAAILYTSGTTGRPKGVMLSHRNIVQNVIGSRSLVEITPGDRFLSILPLAHTYECTIGFLIPFSAGASVTYLGKPPVLSALLPALSEVRPTMMVSVPLIMEKLYDSRIRSIFTRNLVTRALRRIGPLRRLIHRAAGRRVFETFGGALHFYGIGGAPLSPDAERFLREARFPYAIGYGLTETSPLVAGTDAANTKFRSTGPPIRGVEIRLDPHSGDSEQGEILVRGPNVMQGYYRDEDATREVLSDDGWFRTGDLGSRDKDGYLSIRGRLKNMIVGPGGENIYPGDIEEVINEHELALESVVFEWEGQLVARVHVDIEELTKLVDGPTQEPGAVRQKADEILGE
ncbi:MAG TPA: AMP-binding protein, partial [Spirochaetia bacterium]|nr:AMP-binding protein [Spirochaetia bacterium]